MSGTRTNRKIIIGTRGSRLAMVQAQWVLTEISSLCRGLEPELVKVTTAGDRQEWGTLGEGVFVKGLENALIQGDIDIAVHSLKDMPTSIPNEVRLGAVTQRMDPRDVFVSGGRKLSDLAPGAKVGTSSPRRRVQLLNLRPDIEVRELRGNIDTRVRKVLSGELEGMIGASAALIRLNMERNAIEYLSTDEFTPAVGQGALGLEIRSDDMEMAEMVAKLNHKWTWDCIIAERTFLKTMGGGCYAPIAALAKMEGGGLRISGMVASPDGQKVLRAEVNNSALGAEEAGDQLAQKMIDMGASALI